MKEAELFDYLKADLYPDLERSPGIYDSFDCISRIAGHYIELKCRNTHYPTHLMDLPEPEWVNHWMPATTEFSRSQKITKLVGYLDINEAVKI